MIVLDYQSSSHQKKPSAGQVSSPEANKHEAPSSTMYCFVTASTKVRPGLVEVLLDTKKHRVAVGMWGEVLGLPGAKVSIVRATKGHAKARIEARDIENEIDHHKVIVLEPGAGVSDANDANGHTPHRPQATPSTSGR